MTRQMTPELAHNIYMGIFTTDEAAFQTTSEKTRYYSNGIKTLAINHGKYVPRLEALLSKIGDSRCISLFVMPAEPWPVPATMFLQSDAGFDHYFECTVDDFKIRHIIFGNGTKYSFCQDDDSDVTIFLERKSPAKQNNP